MCRICQVDLRFLEAAGAGQARSQITRRTPKFRFSMEGLCREGRSKEITVFAIPVVSATVRIFLFWKLWEADQ